MMRFRSIYALVLFVVLGISAACGTSAEPQSPAPEPAATVAPASLETATPAEDAAEKLRRENHEREVKYVTEAFAFTYDWRDALRGTDGGTVCQLRERHDRLSNAMRTMTRQGVGRRPIWTEVGITEEEAKKKVRDVAIEYAKELNRILDLSDATRREMGACGAGEGSMDLADAGYLTDAIEDALTQYDGGNPEDIGTTPKKLRDRLLGYYLREISAGRAEVKKTGSSFRLSQALSDATYRWNFTRDQLKVTAEELELTHER